MDARVLKRSLSKHASCISVCESLEEGIELLNVKENNFELILTDLNLKDSEGIDTFNRINEHARGLPIIVVSGYSQLESLVEKLLQQGAQDFISKDDISINNLQRIIVSAIDRQKLLSENIKEKDRVQEILKYKTDFLANFSHEIRTPLNAITGNLSLLEEEELSASVMQLIENMKLGCDKLLNSVNEILDLSKMQANKLKLNYTDVSIFSLIEESINLFSNQASSRKILLGSVIDKNVPTTIKGDAHRLQQILNNYLSNALKYTESGSIVLSVKYCAENSEILFQVKDTGRGIGISSSKSLFEKYIQEKKNDTYIGTGLGLSICKLLAELFAGNVGAYNNKENGATFWFSFAARTSNVHEKFPLIEVPLLLVSRKSSRDSFLYSQLKDRCSNLEILEFNADFGGLNTKKFEEKVVIIDDFEWEKNEIQAFFNLVKFNENIKLLTYNRKNIPVHYVNVRQITGDHGALLRTILEVHNGEQNIRKNDIGVTKSTHCWPRLVLICDDDTLNRKLIIKILNSLDIDALEAGNGIDAIDQLKMHPEIDAIFMDCSMPQMDGFEATTKIREFNSSVPIVAFTGLQLEEQVRRCKEVGMDLYVAKPIRKRTITETLKKLRKVE